jgi:hypothetical protein
MKAKAPLGVLAGILLLATSAGVILAVENLRGNDRAERAQEFQRLVGGLGLGPAVDLSGCPCSFDPRLCHRCSADLGPIPGGGWFCPQHACSIFYYPRLAPAR